MKPLPWRRLPSRVKLQRGALLLDNLETDNGLSPAILLPWPAPTVALVLPGQDNPGSHRRRVSLGRLTLRSSFPSRARLTKSRTWQRRAAPSPSLRLLRLPPCRRSLCSGESAPPDDPDEERLSELEWLAPRRPLRLREWDLSREKCALAHHSNMVPLRQVTCGASPTPLLLLQVVPFSRLEPHWVWAGRSRSLAPRQSWPSASAAKSVPQTPRVCSDPACSGATFKRRTGAQSWVYHTQCLLLATTGCHLLLKTRDTKGLDVTSRS